MPLLVVLSHCMSAIHWLGQVAPQFDLAIMQMMCVTSKERRGKGCRLSLNNPYDCVP